MKKLQERCENELFFVTVTQQHSFVIWRNFIIFFPDFFKLHVV